MEKQTRTHSKKNNIPEQKIRRLISTRTTSTQHSYENKTPHTTKAKTKNPTLEEYSNLLVSNRPFPLLQGLPLFNG